MKVICSGRNTPECLEPDCEHALSHDEFYECTQGPCSYAPEATCINTKEAKEARVKELQAEIAQLKLELQEYIEEVLPDEQE